MENVQTRNVDESLKRFLDPNTDDLPDLTSSSEFTDTSLVKFSRTSDHERKHESAMILSAIENRLRSGLV